MKITLLLAALLCTTSCLCGDDEFTAAVSGFKKAAVKAVNRAAKKEEQKRMARRAAFQQADEALMAGKETGQGNTTAAATLARALAREIQQPGKKQKPRSKRARRRLRELETRSMKVYCHLGDEHAAYLIRLDPFSGYKPRERRAMLDLAFGLAQQLTVEALAPEAEMAKAPDEEVKRKLQRLNSYRLAVAIRDAESYHAIATADLGEDERPYRSFGALAQTPKLYRYFASPAAASQPASPPAAEKGSQ